MNRQPIATFLLLAAWCAVGSLAGQVQPPPVPDPPGTQKKSGADILRDFIRNEAPGPPAANRALPLQPDPALADPATRAAYQESLRSYYDYHRWGLNLRRSTYEWQLLSSRIIFFTVLVLVGVGVYLAWAQFRLDRVKQAPPAVTEIAAGREGIRVNSPVLGVIILVISFLFFYLYLAFVYPISETF